jgi:hypothetical protein
MSQAIFTAHSRLSTVGVQLLRDSGGADSAGGRRLISEWWTQMDGFWGPNTTRALQQYLNSQRSAEEPEFEMLTVDANFGTLTVKALQHFLNRCRAPPYLGGPCFGPVRLMQRGFIQLHRARRAGLCGSCRRAPRKMT